MFSALLAIWLPGLPWTGSGWGTPSSAGSGGTGTTASGEAANMIAVNVDVKVTHYIFVLFGEKKNGFKLLRDTK